MFTLCLFVYVIPLFVGCAWLGGHVERNMHDHAYRTAQRKASKP